ncbi:multidrug ABC transporter ATP-binding protein [Paenibacillus baekrokdamisoli]|uniref:Multidrug ABC transporter ATP-binding protein n=1 Tax=Paenibacillus baekrokdamisoli TaxID=1712516 RepID=A0A3G9JGC1_9BACL|nr:ABC transporter ATP-binding protein [Paenibacillus baekrokdamisoli]MBB3070868.1 ABC-2 type transport system ATP-binding protein [Paenibacillus baekrokdamisoli]BBH22194.1 multidrug ABC transporter ATP-binding protein [Paenibacillus baekrokdamisoli]
MILKTNGLTKTYATGSGCTDITLEVKRGQIFGLLGPNGAGKSTFVKMIVGLLHPTSGSGQLFGLPIGATESRRRIGYLPELFRFQDWLTGTEVLAYHACLSGMTLSQTRSPRMVERFKEVLNQVGLEQRGHDRVRQYSKGMQQRLGIACALLMDPELIILDEPSSALDPIGRYEVRELLEGLRSEGKTVFLNTHLLEDVEALCDEVAFLHQGRLRAVGPMSELLRSGMNWEIHVGGWFPELMDTVSQQLLPGLTCSLKTADDNGEAILNVTARNREQIGWINRVLMEQAVTIYEVRPVQGRLEEWFLAMSGSQEELRS